VEVEVDEMLVEVTSAHSVIPALAKNHGAVRPDESRLFYGGEAGIHGSPTKTFGGDRNRRFGDDINEGYDFDFYSFEDALELIRPEFAAAESVVKKWSLGSYGF
jgi:hypothetical protein